MPFSLITTLNPERLKVAAQTLCDVFGIASLHPHQEETGRNILRGISTFLDVPTGGGKTIAFWYALFYHWQPGNTAKDCQKIILLVGPLVGVLEAQAKTLNAKGIPAAAITSKSNHVEELLTHLGNKKFRVVHCICEWGGDDFRPEYRQIVQLAARLPTGTPILAATATAPHDIIKDILCYLNLPDDIARVQVSNEKLNVSLSVCILQHEPESFADLITLFPEDFQKPEDFAQTLIYVNGRQDSEKLQDFL
ncbi:hypothetical protein B0H19DRAFT_1058625 [Mycena capillaripes]|nr:hypothetical protein B0H19DRAFT_1058625 [Mycena capillaripes]